MLGLKQNSYLAYCVDEAVIYFGMTFENMLEEAGHKPSKEERKAEAARQRVYDKVMSEDTLENSKAGYADPALMFQ